MRRAWYVSCRGTTHTLIYRFSVTFVTALNSNASGYVKTDLHNNRHFEAMVSNRFPKGIHKNGFQN